jgi:hypothetical protein
MTTLIKQGSKAQIVQGNDSITVSYIVLTASGFAHKIKVCADMDEANEFFAMIENNPIKSNGFERYGAVV